MPPLTDLTRVRALLDQDRAWSAYAIGDLDAQHAPSCSWYSPADGSPALLLVYRGFTLPILFAIGDEAAVAALVSEIDAPEVSLHVRGDVLEAISPVYAATSSHAMWRMVVDAPSFRAADDGEVVTLDESDLPDVAALYDDGYRHGEGPTFFQPFMLRQGTFHGVREGRDLVAVAGTHLFSAALGVCTIGNVYTRRDRRGRGLAGRVTSAVVRQALVHSIPTIVLNVGQNNNVARRVYERLGFRTHCEFFEGEASCRR
jgi:ribosomal protein S18 acetylase RimI-like enzyme